MTPGSRAATFQTITQTVRAASRHVRRLLPGERPSSVVIELTGTIAPRTKQPRFFGLPIRPPGQPRALSLEGLAEILDELARARWVKRVVFRIQGVHADPATAYALRRQIIALGDAGKETVAYLSEISLPAYYLASAAKFVVAPESADISLRGMGRSIMFMRDTLAKIGVRYEKLAIDEYKSAWDRLSRSDMNPAHREQLEALMDRSFAHFTAAIAERRGLTPERVRALVDDGITTAERALAEKLLDRVAYEDEVIGEDHRPLSEARRFLAPRTPAIGGRRVALVSLTGAIVTGKSRGIPLPIPVLGGRMAGSETLVRALRTAAADEATAAVVLFVDSVGGSPLASDLIWREMQRLRQKKPVVAVMGAVAASGGYYVLTHATRVIAAPTTITGSIGVITGKLVFADLFARAGVNVERVQRGRYAMLFDSSRALDDGERALLQRRNAEIYDRFITRVAEGRKLTPARVRELARGRLWSGTDAVELGLADELGDLETGLARARELGGLGPDAPVWDVPAPGSMVLPFGNVEAILSAVLPFAHETSWMVMPARFQIG